MENQASENTGVNMTKEQAKTLSTNLLAIIQKCYQEHNYWVQGWFQWVNQRTMNMQFVPQEAYQDYDNRNAWLMNFIQSFTPAAEVLKTIGEIELHQLIQTSIEDTKKATKAFQEARSNVAASQATTNQNILNIQKQTSQQIFDMQRSTMQNQQRSNDMAHSQFMDYLRS